MIFGKKKRMIDVRELQRRGVVHIPKEEIVIPTDKEGFVEFGRGSKAQIASPSKQSSSSSGNFFGFMDSSSSSSSSSNSFGTEAEGYNKREVDSKIIGLDNKIYKLEQRIELLERKLDVNRPTDSNTGVMGW
ncbi:MAG: hypothetical protein NUV97_01460 [archaeon]|nr:hypothetical protein [archaeon]MCR4323621.1 hypothetical protein [Nanoarchaeota archaeon]